MIASNSLSQFLQVIISGITQGSVYALVGMGLILIYNATRVINLAQGEFYSLGALLLISLVGAFDMPLPVGLALSAVVVCLVGLAMEEFGIRRRLNSSLSNLLLVTLGFSMLIKGISSLLWGKDPYSLPGFTGDAPIRIWGASLSPQVLWVMGTIALVLLFLWYFFDRTLFGKAIRATSENKEAAALCGVNVSWVIMFSFGLSAVIGALSGMVIAPISFATYDGGTMIGLKGFVAATLGGLNNTWGAAAGGFILGFLEAFGAGYVSSQFKDVFALAMLLVILSYRSRSSGAET